MLHDSYEQFLKQGKLLTNTLIKKDYQQSRLKSSFRKFYVSTKELTKNDFKQDCC